MGIFDKSNYIVNTEQVFQCTAKVLLLAILPWGHFFNLKIQAEQFLIPGSLMDYGICRYIKLV